MYIGILVYVCVYIYIYIYIYTHTYTNIPIYIYVSHNMMRTKLKECSYVQLVTLKFIEILKIKNYNIEHTQNTRLHFRKHIYSFLYITVQTKMDVEPQKRCSLLLCCAVCCGSHGQPSLRKRADM